MAEIENVLSRLKEIFNKTKLKYTIFGGISVIYYGKIRTTQDIDILIEDDKEKFDNLIELLNIYNFEITKDQFYLGYEEKSHISIFDNLSYFRLDIKVASTEFENNMIKNAVKRELIGHKLYIATLEYVLASKILYIGNIEGISELELLEFQDVLDFLTLYHINKDRINNSLLLKLCNDLGLEDTLKRLLDIKI